MRSRTYIATPPGATIREQLADRGMSQKEFAARMDMSEKHICRLISGDVILTPEVAMRLEMVLGVPASFWLNLEAIYREKLLLVQAENEMDEDLEIAGKFPYREMVKYGWIEDAKRGQDRVIALRKFFEVVRLSLVDIPLLPHIACRRSAVTEKADYALIAWAQKAKKEARSVETGAVNLERLRKYVPVIRKMTTENADVFCPKLCSLLSECGIALIFLPHIGGSFLNGAAFSDRNRIVIGLTVRGRDADRFWVSLFHEIGHVLYGHIWKEDGTTDEDENEADSFARDTLISPQDFEAFLKEGHFDSVSILSFAREIGIDSGIVVGRLQKEGFIRYNQYNELKTKYSLDS